jgi:hypothetical protein
MEYCCFTGTIRTEETYNSSRFKAQIAPFNNCLVMITLFKPFLAKFCCRIALRINSWPQWFAFKSAAAIFSPKKEIAFSILQRLAQRFSIFTPAV